MHKVKKMPPASSVSRDIRAIMRKAYLWKVKTPQNRFLKYLKLLDLSA